MSVTCPQGHTSEATDYCDQCGARIAGAPSPAPLATPAEGAAAQTPAAPASVAPSAAPVATRTCPHCSGVNDEKSRYCEECGYDFVTGTAPALELPVPAAGASASASAATPAGAAVTADWELVVQADQAFYDRNHIVDIPFPVACPERRFALNADRMVIGRHSASKGVEPEIDLSGAPQDAAVSHVHAILVRDPAAATWTIVDPGSANGTYVNDGADPIPVNTPVPLTDGATVHIGAWTTLTLHKRSA